MKAVPVVRARKSAKPRKLKRTEPDIWDQWQAKGYTLPSDEELHRLSQPDAVAPIGGRLIPYETEPKEETQ